MSSSIAAVPREVTRRVLAPPERDAILTLQLAVAWAGERGEDEPRLGWWDTDMVSQYGGHTLLRAVAPRTYAWAALEVAREAARRKDEAARARDADADRLVSLFRFGFDIDEQLEDRLAEHKREGLAPELALPKLSALFERWDRNRFASWLEAVDAPNTVNDPTGRRLTGAPPSDVVETAQRLARALAPFSDNYPCPHYRDASAAD